MLWIENIAHHYNYWVCILLMSAGLYAMINGGNLIKKLMGLAILQTSVLLFYISIGYVEGARFPILSGRAMFYINPLPHVLMLTAIVVGVATFAVGLALAVRIRESYGTVEEDEILALDARATRFMLQMTGAAQKTAEKTKMPEKAMTTVSRKARPKAKKKISKKSTAAKKKTTRKKPAAKRKAASKTKGKKK